MAAPRLGCYVVFAMGTAMIVADTHTHTQSQDTTFSRGMHATRRTWKSRAVKCPPLSERAIPGYYRRYRKSQEVGTFAGEDRRLLQFFNGLCFGTYLELGALDGKSFSNSYFFNQARNLSWSGVLIEGAPDAFEEMQLYRPRELATVNAVVCGEERVVHWVDARDRLSPVRGIWEFMSDDFRKLWYPDVDTSLFKPVMCKPLRDIIKESVQEPFFFDFFSLDVEGAELAVLQSLDFDQVGFGIIIVEADDIPNTQKNKAVRSFLESKDYRYLDSVGPNEWYFNSDFANIYMGLLR